MVSLSNHPAEAGTPRPRNGPVTSTILLGLGLLPYHR